MKIFQKLLNNGHFETLYPYFFKTAPVLNYKRERINTRDGDFLDLDWVKEARNSLVIISHGLESSSNAKYVRSLGECFLNNKVDVLAWNFRGCSGVMNNSLRYYHSGATNDLEDVIKHVHTMGIYDSIFLVGFSLGANLTLKYMGEQSDIIDERIKGAVAISAPVCLKSSSHKLNGGFNKIYTQNFLKSLKEKVRLKKDDLRKFGIIVEKVNKLKNLPAFDDQVTGPLHGFKDANDYYKKCSSKFFLPDISKPTLILNALNDPFLTEECFPLSEVSKNKNLSLISAERGGHVGFQNFEIKGCRGFEEIALDFYLKCIE